MLGVAKALPDNPEGLRTIVAQQAAIIAQNKIELTARSNKITLLEAAEVAWRATVWALEAQIEIPR